MPLRRDPPVLLLATGLALALLGTAPVAAPAQIYVDKDRPRGGDGTSWADAYASLQPALANASAGDQVWVADGTYYPDVGPNATADSRGASFSLPDGVTVIGGFKGYNDGAEQTLADRPSRFAEAVTTLSGEIQQDDDATNNAYHVVTSRGDSDETALRRVRVAHGTANGTGEQGRGGGILLDGSDAIIVNTYVQRNRARRGAAIAVTDGTPTLQGLLVNANQSSENGAVYLDGDRTILNHVTVADNTTTSADGVNGVYRVSSDATVYNTAYGTDTTNGSVELVTATLDGSLTQEGTALPNTDLVITNADQDTLGTTTSASAGSFSFQTTYPAPDAPTVTASANTPEHQASTTTLSLADQDSTYNASVDLERLTHRVAITTSDAATGDPLPAAGRIADPVADTTLAHYDTGSNATDTTTIRTPLDQVAVSADTANYDQATEQVSLGGKPSVTSTPALQPIQYTFTGTVADQDTNAVNDATILLSDDAPTTDTLSATTNPDGSYSITGTTNQGGLDENDDLTLHVAKQGYNDTTATATADPTDRDKTQDFYLQAKPDTVTATIDVSTNQEGTVLSGADITATNIDADTTVATTTSDANGDATITTSYPDTAAYTVALEATSPDHAAATDTVELGTTDKSYASELGLERLVHGLTIATQDSATGNALPAQGDVLDAAQDTLIAEFDTGGDATTATTIRTPADSITVSADTTNYDPDTTGIRLDGVEDRSTTLSLPPITYELSGTLQNKDGDALDGTVVAEDTDGNTVSFTVANDGTWQGTTTINDGFEANEPVTLAATAPQYQADTLDATTDPSSRTIQGDFALDVDTTQHTVTFNATMVGNDLYEDGDGDGLGYDDVSFAPENGRLDSLSLAYDNAAGADTSQTVGFGPDREATATFTTADTSQAVVLSQDDNDAIQTWLLNKPGTTPDLRRDFQGATGFEPTPYKMSNYDNPPYEDQTPSDYNKIPIDPDSLETSYEARAIPARTPRPADSRVDGSRDTGWETYDSTIDEWQLHISGQGSRWRQQSVNGNEIRQLQTRVLEGSSAYESTAMNAWDVIRDILPYPNSSPQKIQKEPSISASDTYNLVYTNDAGAGNSTTRDSLGFNKAGLAEFGTNRKTGISELYSAVSGGYGTVQGEEPGDTTFDDQGNPLLDKMEFPLRVDASITQESNIR